MKALLSLGKTVLLGLAGTFVWLSLVLGWLGIANGHIYSESSLTFLERTSDVFQATLMTFTFGATAAIPASIIYHFAMRLCMPSDKWRRLQTGALIGALLGAATLCLISFVIGLPKKTWPEWPGLFGFLTVGYCALWSGWYCYRRSDWT